MVPHVLRPFPGRPWVRLLTLHLILISFLAGCGDENDPVATVEGTYRLDTYLVNASGCEGDGEDQLLTTEFTHVVVFSHRVVGMMMHRLVGCKDEADCQDIRRAIIEMETAMLPSLNFNFRRPTSEGLSDIAQSTGYSSGDRVCRMPQRVVTNLVSIGENQIQLVSETSIGDDYPADDEGYCTIDLGSTATANAACTSKTTLTATMLP